MEWWCGCSLVSMSTLSAVELQPKIMITRDRSRAVVPILSAVSAAKIYMVRARAVSRCQKQSSLLISIMATETLGAAVPFIL